MWRPGNWADLKLLSELKYGGREFCRSPSDYEAGADAMLEAIKRETMPDDIANAVKQMWVGNIPTNWDRPHGQVVFIPDEEK